MLPFLKEGKPWAHPTTVMSNPQYVSSLKFNCEKFPSWTRVCQSCHGRHLTSDVDTTSIDLPRELKLLKSLSNQYELMAEQSGANMTSSEAFFRVSKFTRWRDLCHPLPIPTSSPVQTLAWPMPCAIHLVSPKESF